MMNKQHKLDVMILRAKMRAEETLTEFQEAWLGEVPQMPKKEEVPAPNIEEVE